MALLPIFIALTLIAIHLNRVAYWVPGGIKGFWQDTRLVALVSKVLLIISLFASLFLQLLLPKEIVFTIVVGFFMAHLVFLLWLSMKN
jgi:hypothetical protein